MIQKAVSIGVGVAIIGVAGVWIYDRVHMMRLRERIIENRRGMGTPGTLANQGANSTTPKPTAGT